ncbi:MAG: in-like serine protease [Phycisphaerales bacterium]|nr:in-like serine protease [Phycisphaerales bacterium]
MRQVFDATHALSTAAIDVTLTAGQVKTGLIIGSKVVTPPPGTNTASLAGSAFNDNNNNAKYDGGDGVGKGLTIFLDLNNDNVLDAGEKSVISDANGKFSFTALAAGTYHVRRVFAAGQTYSTPPIDVTLVAGQAKTGLLLGTKKI